MHIADTLSRASQLESTSKADEFEVHLLVQISKEKADEFKRETDSDPVLSKLKKVILTGWPENWSEVEPELQDYWNFRDELCICDGLLMKGDRLITLYSFEMNARENSGQSPTMEVKSVGPFQ